MKKRWLNKKKKHENWLSKVKTSDDIFCISVQEYEIVMNAIGPMAANLKFF